eukprot:scaffold41013_cov250-Skeletonema_dohrnii-CCMP3373.AAC.7
MIISVLPQSATSHSSRRIGSRFVMYVMRFLLQLLRHLLPSPKEAEAEAGNTRHLADGTAVELSTEEVTIIFSFLSHNEIMHARVCETWWDAAKKTIEDEIEMRHADYDDDDETAATEDLSTDEVAIIFSFLSRNEIMHARVCETWKDAAKKTIEDEIEIEMHHDHADYDDETVATEDLSIDEVAIIFSFLPHVVDIMRARRVCVAWREAAKKTIVPPSEFEVDSDISYNAMRVMSTALPNLQQLSLHSLNASHKYSDGEDPERWQARRAPLNGRFHVLFDFPLLQHLYVNCAFLKWDLNILDGFPLLKELELMHTNTGTGISLLTGNLSSLRVLHKLEMVTLDDNPHLTGNLSSLRVLNGTLEKLFIRNCRSITGNFMDLADFPRLTELDLIGTAVEGSILDIRQDDFSVLKTLSLPSTVQGGVGYKFQHIAEVPNFMQAIHFLLRRTPTLFEKDRLLRAFGWKLSVDSPDWYDSDWIWHRTSIRSKFPFPPFALQFIHVGPRLGWSWCDIDVDAHSCEINWLDPAPSSESSDHEAYIEDLQRIEQRTDKDFYRGYHHPPNEEQYRRLCEEFFQRLRILLI